MTAIKLRLSENKLMVCKELIHPTTLKGLQLQLQCLLIPCHLTSWKRPWLPETLYASKAAVRIHTLWFAGDAGIRMWSTSSCCSFPQYPIILGCLCYSVPWLLDTQTGWKISPYSKERRTNSCPFLRWASLGRGEFMNLAWKWILRLLFLSKGANRKRSPSPHLKTSQNVQILKIHTYV